MRLKELLPGFRVDVGRMGYAGGMESPSGDRRLEAVKNRRVAARLLGEFEWSLYQRAYDGVRLDYARPTWHASVLAAHPTQGGFEDAAGLPMEDIDVLAGSLTLKPGGPLPHTETQGFFYRYADRRAVRARVDNTGLPPVDRVNSAADAVASKSTRVVSERVGAVVARGEAAVGFQQVPELLEIDGIRYVGEIPCGQDTHAAAR